MSDTPETDAFYAKLYAPNVPAAMIEIACGDERRKMQSFERQRNEARAEAARLQMELDASCNAEELRQVREENARLREAINQAHKVLCCYDIAECDLDEFEELVITITNNDLRSLRNTLATLEPLITP